MHVEGSTRAVKEPLNGIDSNALRKGYGLVSGHLVSRIELFVLVVIFA